MPTSPFRKTNSDLNGASAPLTTPGRMRITLDPVGGSDSAKFVVGTDVDPAGLDRNPGPTYTATLQTLQGVAARLPFEWRHPTNGLITGGPDWVITDHVISNEVRYIDFGAGTYDAVPGLYVNGAKNVTLGNTAANIHTSLTIGNSGLALAVDVHRGAVLEVVSGTGVGQWRRVARNSATTLSPVDAFTVTPNATSVFRVWRPASKIAGTVAVANIQIAFATGGVTFSPEVELEVPASGFGMFVGQAGVTVGASLTGASISSHRLMQIGPTSVLYPQWVDYWRDPNLLAQMGLYGKDGEVFIYDAYNVVNGKIWGQVLDRVKYTVQDGAYVQIKIDADGDTAGVRSTENFLTITGASRVELAKGSNAGSTIRRFSAGAIVDDRSYLDATGCDFSDHTNEGVQITNNSVANVRNVTSVATNLTYGVWNKSGHGIISRTGTTIGGNTSPGRLGNAASGDNLAFSAVLAGDCTMNLPTGATFQDQ